MAAVQADNHTSNTLLPDAADASERRLPATNGGLPPTLPQANLLSVLADGGAAQGLPLASVAPRVSVVIPTLNEEENLPHVFCHLPTDLHEVIVVDGHSTDHTVGMARMLRPDVRIVMQSGRGKGNALAAAFRECTGDIVVTLDADGSTDGREIPRFVAALWNGADFVKGSRFAQGGASADITFVRKLGNRALSTLVNGLYGTSYTDLCYGYNAFWARCLPYLRVDCDGFEVETLINVRIAKAGLVVHEVPSYERNRLNGMSNLHAVRDGTRVLRTIALERMSAASRQLLRATSCRATSRSSWSRQCRGPLGRSRWCSARSAS